jgi:hypothetical protein
MSLPEIPADGATTPAQPPVPATHGTVLFARYAFMPNHLERCGPLRAQDNRTILDYAAAGATDPYLEGLLREFQAAYPYLRLIAQSTGHRDPFHPAVVEAYWIGSDLLEGVEVRRFHASLQERFGRQLTPKSLDYLLGKAPAGARPHHSFNVFDVQRFTQEKTHSLHAMEKCRIGWGRVIAADATTLAVEYQPLIWDSPASHRRAGLTLGPPSIGRILRRLDGKGFADRAQPGDWISFHWDWACDVLTEGQRVQLERWTRHHIRLANETL